MPLTRSDTSRTKTASTDETSTSRDWSLNTPETTSASATSRSTLTRRTPPPCIEDDRLRNVTDPLQGTESNMQQNASIARPITRIEEVTETSTKSQERRPTREIDTQSIHSSHKKKATEARARKEIAQRELEVAQAKLKLAQAAFEEVESDEELEVQEAHQHSREIEEWLIQTENRIESQPKKPARSEKNEIQQLASAIAMLARSPDQANRFTELPHFSGTCEEWLAFKRTYEDTARTLSNAQNLARLRRSVQGRAREAVQSLLFTADNPEEVLKGLEARFGRPGALALSELEKIKNLPKVTENPGDICIFASKIRNSVATIRALKKQQYLSSPETMKAIVEKMPASMKFRWFTYHRTRREEDLPELSLIEEFLEIEADICGDFAPPEASWDNKRPHKSLAPPDNQWEQRRLIRKPIHHVQEVQEVHENRRFACPMCQEEHPATDCAKFKAISINERWDIIKKAKICFKCLKSRHSRTNCRAPACKKCGRWHHIIMHSDSVPVTSKKERELTEPMQRSNDTTSEEKIASVHTTSDEGKAYLKMVPVDLYGPKGRSRILALLDEGSTVTLLDSAVARKIGAEGKKQTLTIETVGGRSMKKESSQKITLKIKGAHRKDKKSIAVRTIDDLQLSNQEVTERTVEGCPHLEAVKDQLIYTKEKPKLLIGQDNWGLIVTRKLRKGVAKDPVASLTNLGWVLHGQETGTNTVVNFINFCKPVENNIEEMIKEHFELESLGIQAKLPQKDHDRRALEILEETTKKLPSGQYETGLLWKTEKETLPNNYSQGLRRLTAIERKLDQNKELKESYNKQMTNLIANKYAEEAPRSSTEGRTFYLPHFAVEHPVKKKPRIVFDAAATFKGKSLNEALLPGPDLLQSLFGVLLRFREGPVAIMADIQDMFLRIKVREADRDSLRFLWRGDNREKKPTEYRMSSVIFGATSSPATAIFVMNKNAEASQTAHPAAVKAIQRNHYMDDYLQSFATISEARETSLEVKRIHEEAGFHLKGWASNDDELLKEFSERNEGNILKITKEEKTLGLRWLTKEDSLAFNLGLRNTSEELIKGNKNPTKRQVTSAVMSTFDPMGLAAPVLIQGKKLIQDIWRSKIDWDDVIQPDHMITWLKYVKEVGDLINLKIPRCISAHSRKGQLHTFTDASEEAYATSVYWRSEGPDGEISVTLIAGKARVTPTKPVSIPRLELQAALLGSRLAASIQKETSLEITKRVFWTDSSTVLQWVKSDPRKFKTFVAHRLAEIEELTAPQEWRWVPTKENPADDATRGTPNEFNHTARWFRGPTFLRHDESDWPAKRFEHSTESPEQDLVQRVATVITQNSQPDLARFSSWLRLLRTMARVYQFIDLTKKEGHERVNTAKKGDETWKPIRKTSKESTRVQRVETKTKRYFLPLQEKHERQAEEYLIRKSQNESFEKELKSKKSGKPLEKSSRLKKIDTYIASNGVLKLRIRTRKFTDDVQQRVDPAILDGRHRTTQLIIKFYHEKFLHGNTATLMNEIRQRYWILGLRAAVKSEIHHCQWCRLRKSAPQLPPTGDLPRERLQHHQPPFSHAAVDCFGPMQVTVGRRKEKRWGALFTCLTTRAVHLELVPSLNTSSMVMALRRMAARRGTPKVLFSDNGTNFVGANRELTEAAQEKGIKWKFIPPGCPNMGGAWERLVRSVKTALAVVLHEKSPSEEVLHTLLTEVEHVINSRPLTHLSMEPDDEESLTPNHFLLGRSCGAWSPGEFNNCELVGRASWRTVQVLTDHFWKKWIREYLPTLMPRQITGRETTDPEEGDIVLLVDATLPRNSWPRGKVIQAYPGPDGRTRILDIQTSGGVLRRPSRRVVILVPARSSLQQDGVLCTAGENVSDENE